MNARTPFCLLLAFSLAACASATHGGDRAQAVADGSTFALPMGGRVALADGGALRYVRLVKDSRCAPDVQCVWAGDAVIAVEWTPESGGAQAFELHTGLEPRSKTLGARMVTLVSLDRGDAPEAQLKIEGGD